jgi:hypothetical protein
VAVVNTSNAVAEAVVAEEITEVAVVVILKRRDTKKRKIKSKIKKLTGTLSTFLFLRKLVYLVHLIYPTNAFIRSKGRKKIKWGNNSARRQE